MPEVIFSTSIPNSANKQRRQKNMTNDENAAPSSEQSSTAQKQRPNVQLIPQDQQKENSSKNQSISQSERDRFIEEMLSPVSKLDRARQLAAIEQKRRIDAACERRVQERKAMAMKRKATEKRLESHIKKKIKRKPLSELEDEELEKQFDEEDEDNTSSFGKWFFSTINNKNPDVDIAKPEHIVKKVTYEDEASQTDAELSSTVEGNEIKHTLLSPRSTLKITKITGENATAFALRAAAERKRDRDLKRAEMEKTKSQFQLKQLAGYENAVKNIYTPRNVVEHTQEQMQEQEKIQTQDVEQEMEKAVDEEVISFIKEENIPLPSFSPPIEAILQPVAASSTLEFGEAQLSSSIFSEKSAVSSGGEVQNAESTIKDPLGTADAQVNSAIKDPVTFVNNTVPFNSNSRLAMDELHYIKEKMNDEELSSSDESFFYDNHDFEEEEVELTRKKNTDNSWRLLLLGSFGAFFAFFFIISNNVTTTFCNSQVANSTDQCIPCPSNGRCSEGLLISCDEQYVQENGQKCIERSLIQDNTMEMLSDILSIVWKKADLFFYPISLLTLFENRHNLLKVSKVVTRDIYNSVRTQSPWKKMSNVAFNATFDRAFQRFLKRERMALKLTTLEIPITLNGHASYGCQLLYLMMEHIEIISACIFFFFVNMALYFRRKRRVNDEVIVNKLVGMVHDKLIDQSMASIEELQGYPCDNLRDHLVDVLELESTAARNRVMLKLWPRVIDQINADSRIRQRTLMHKGHEVIYWEWISPDATKSCQRKQILGHVDSPGGDEKCSDHIQKTLDFSDEEEESSPLPVVEDEEHPPVQLI